MKSFVFLILSFFIAREGFGKDFCLHPDNHYKVTADLILELSSPEGTIFNINMIKSATNNCINPSFPVILVTTTPKMDAWIQIIYTNSEEEKLQNFIDYDPKLTEKPFYSYSNYFYDAPLWFFNNKSQLEWKAHLFPVKIIGKKIQLMSGIEWGFIIKDGKVETLIPKIIDKNDITKAIKFLSQNLPDKSFMQ